MEIKKNSEILNADSDFKNQLEQPFINGRTLNCEYFRIPVLYTLQNGEICSCIDARFGSGGDSPENIDTALRFYKSGKWQAPFLLNYFDDFANESGANKGSASFIDTAMVQDDLGRLYLLCDAFPAGAGLFGECLADSGMVNINESNCLLLAHYTMSESGKYEYYLEENRNSTLVCDKYLIKRISDHQFTGYTTDFCFNLFYQQEPLHVLQKDGRGQNNGKKAGMNIFYKDAKFKVMPTSYLYLRTSDDNGKTWNYPKIITDFLKPAHAQFLGIAPGRGVVLKKGKYKGRILFAVYSFTHGHPARERTHIMYSDDRGRSWNLGDEIQLDEQQLLVKSSEAQIIELPNGVVRVFSRTEGGHLGYADSVDGGIHFTRLKSENGFSCDSNCQFSVISYSKDIQGYPAVILSAPKKKWRNSGNIWIGLIKNDAKEKGEYKIDWKYEYEINKDQFFAYSCLTETSDGKIAILYEEQPDKVVYKEFDLNELMDKYQDEFKL